jgi:hypothetical protein
MGTLAVDNIQHTDGSSAVTLNNAGITGGTIGSAVTGTLGSGVTVEGTLNSNTTFSGDAGQKTAKAWVNYNQTSDTVNDSFNVSSVTDDSAGVFIVNFNFTWASTSYAVSSWVRSEYTDSYARCISARGNHSKTTTAMVFLTSVSGNDLARDMPESGLIFFGD